MGVNLCIIKGKISLKVTEQNHGGQENNTSCALKENYLGIINSMKILLQEQEPSSNFPKK